MAFFDFIENFFFISLGITFALVLLLVYHFKQRISSMERKGDTMYELITNIVKEMRFMKTSCYDSIFASTASSASESPSTGDIPPSSSPEILGVANGSEPSKPSACPFSTLPSSFSVSATSPSSANIQIVLNETNSAGKPEGKIVVSDDSSDDDSSDDDASTISEMEVNSESDEEYESDYEPEENPNASGNVINANGNVVFDYSRINDIIMPAEMKELLCAHELPSFVGEEHPPSNRVESILDAGVSYPPLVSETNVSNSELETYMLSPEIDIIQTPPFTQPEEITLDSELIYSEVVVEPRVEMDPTKVSTSADDSNRVENVFGNVVEQVIESAIPTFVKEETADANIVHEMPKNEPSSALTSGTPEPEKKNTREVYRKMNITQLRAIAIAAGIQTDTTKLKKNDLIQLLENLEE